MKQTSTCRNVGFLVMENMKCDFQSELFKEEADEWQKEWQNMPEFIQHNKQPVQKIVVSFETKEDVIEFAKITGYNITDKTKSIWFPFKEKDTPRFKTYIDNE